MARKKFGFEKRQRELSKERKKEEKRLRRLDRQQPEQLSDPSAQEPGEGSAPEDDGRA